MNCPICKQNVADCPHTVEEIENCMRERKSVWFKLFPWFLIIGFCIIMSIAAYNEDKNKNIPLNKPLQTLTLTDDKGNTYYAIFVNGITYELYKQAND